MCSRIVQGDSEELLEEMPGQEANEVRELLEFDPATAGE